MFHCATLFDLLESTTKLIVRICYALDAALSAVIQALILPRVFEDPTRMCSTCVLKQAQPPNLTMKLTAFAAACAVLATTA
jgi:hypothetical protein